MHASIGIRILASSYIYYILNPDFLLVCMTENTIGLIDGKKCCIIILILHLYVCECISLCL